MILKEQTITISRRNKMKRFDEYRKEVQEKYGNMEKPEKIKQWFYYEKGKAYGPFETQPDKKNKEMVVVNNDEIKNYWETIKKMENESYENWFNDLKEEYNYLNFKTFNLCYSMAYDRGHSYGYDEVANYMIDIANFAENIIKANKEK
jgi:hypothetical protein